MALGRRCPVPPPRCHSTPPHGTPPQWHPLTHWGRDMARGPAAAAPRGAPPCWHPLAPACPLAPHPQDAARCPPWAPTALSPPGAPPHRHPWPCHPRSASPGVECGHQPPRLWAKPHVALEKKMEKESPRVTEKPGVTQQHCCSWKPWAPEAERGTGGQCTREVGRRVHVPVGQQGKAMGKGNFSRGEEK